MILTYISTFLPLISGIFVLVIGCLVFFKNRKSRANQIFLAFCLLQLLWFFGTYEMFQAKNDAMSLFWDRFIYMSSVVFLPNILFHFFLAFSRNKNKLHHVLLYVYYLIAGGFFLLARSPLFINGLFRYEWGVHGKAEFWHNIFMLYFILVLATAFYILYKYYQNCQSAYIRQQIKYIYVAFFLLASIGSLGFLPAYGVGIYPFAYTSGAIFAGFLAYAIIRYRLMNVKFAFTRSLLFFILTVMVTGSFVLALFLAGQLFSETSRQGQLVVFGAASLLVVLCLDPLKRFLAKLTDRLFYKEKIDYGQVLQEVSTAINEEIDLVKIDQDLTNILSKSLKLGTAFLLFEAGPDCYLSMAELPKAVSRRKYYQRKHDSIYYKSPLFKYLLKSKELLVTDELERMMFDEANLIKQNFLKKVYDNLRELKASMVIPVFHGEHMNAILVLGHKISGDIYTGEEFHLMNVIAPQIASALEKSRLYQEVKDFNVKLEAEVKRKTADLQAANAKLTGFSEKLKNLNDELKLSNEHLKELDKAKSEFMSIAAHQLRTPLTGIMGYLSMLIEEDYGKLLKDQKPVISELFAAAQRLIRLVNVFLNITRIEAGRFVINKAPADLGELVEKEITELMPNAQKKSLALTYVRPKEKFPVIGDIDKLKDIVVNLVDNAIKYTPKGTVHVDLHKYNVESYELTVKDSGVGIDPKEAPKLFQKFVRAGGGAKIEAGGSGLGLYIVKKIIEAHGGKVWVESEGVNKGATFHVIIPKGDKNKIEAQVAASNNK